MVQSYNLLPYTCSDIAHTYVYESDDNVHFTMLQLNIESKQVHVGIFSQHMITRCSTCLSIKVHDLEAHVRYRQHIHNEINTNIISNYIVAKH